MAGDNKEIILRVENVISGTPTGGVNVAQGANGVPMQGGQTRSAGRFGSFGQGISAQMFVESATRIISATGNAELGSAISKAGSYSFLLGRVLSSGGLDITAWVSLATKTTADIITAFQKSMAAKMAEAETQNAMAIMRMRGGAFSINSNTQISYNKYQKVTFTDRK